MILVTIVPMQPIPLRKKKSLSIIFIREKISKGQLVIKQASDLIMISQIIIQIAAYVKITTIGANITYNLSLANLLSGSNYSNLFDCREWNTGFSWFDWGWKYCLIEFLNRKSKGSQWLNSNTDILCICFHFISSSYLLILYQKILECIKN